MTAVQFIADLIRRLFAKTPWFFKVVQVIGLLATVIVKAPDLLSSFGLHIAIAQDPYKTIIAAAGVVTAVVAQLTVADDSKLKGTINTK